MSVSYNRLWDLLDRMDMGLIVLSEKSNVPMPVFGQMSGGKYISLHHIENFCNVLDCQPGEIFEFTKKE